MADRLRRLTDETRRPTRCLFVGHLRLRERPSGEPGHRRRQSDRPRVARIRQYARVISAGFESDIVHDLREYSTSVPVERLYEALDATEVAPGDDDHVSGHTVINSIEAITRLPSEEFYRLYGQSTNRALVFTDVTRGESPLVALRVVNPTPNAVILHGVDEEDLWDHATDLAGIDGFSLAVSTCDLDSALAKLREFP